MVTKIKDKVKTKVKKVKTGTKRPNPHDIYFQNMMEIIEVARSFFKAYLLPEIAKELDWDTLQITDAVRRESNSHTSYTDITYVCYTKITNIPIYLHVEQERTVRPDILERILKYNLRLFTKHKRQGNKKLPIIVNFVVYNGSKRRNYPYFESLSDYFDIPWMAKLLLDKSFFLLTCLLGRMMN